MIILIHGQDTFRTKHKAIELKEKYIKEVDVFSTSFLEIEGKQLQSADITKLFSIDSLFAKRRLIIIDGIFEHKSNEVLDLLTQELSKPANDHIVIFCENNIELDESKKPVIISGSGSGKALNKSQQKLWQIISVGYCQYFPLLNNTELIRWIEKKTASYEIKVTKGASQSLVALIGNDLWSMNNELDKICAYKQALKSYELDLNDVKLMVNYDLSQPIFDLTDAISNRDRGRAVKILADQLSQKVPDLYLLAMLARQFKILLSVRQALDDGLSGKSLSDHLKLNSYVLQKSINQARNFNVPVLQSIINTLVKIDYRYKTGNLPIETMVDVLIARI